MNIFTEIFKSMVPVRLEAMWGDVVRAFGILASHIWGAWNNMTEVLVVMMAIDYASGVLAAFINPELAANSKKGFIGIARKVFIFLLVSFGGDGE